MPPIRKKTTKPEPESSIAEVLDRLYTLEEDVAYLEDQIKNRPELKEETVYDVVEAVVVALRAVNLQSTHVMADEFEEKYFGKEKE